MHKNKRKEKESKIIWKDIFLWIVVIVVGVVGGKYLADWLSTLHTTGNNYAQIGEVNWQNGLPIVITYCSFLVLMIIGGYLVAKKMESVNR